jgi:hypothetical protein
LEYFELMTFRVAVNQSSVRCGLPLGRLNQVIKRRYATREASLSLSWIEIHG